MKEKYKAIMITSLIGLIVVSTTGIYYSIAQVPTEKPFYLGTNPSGTLDDFNYTSGDQLSYDIQGYPPITITIHKWSELATPEKALITARLTSMGYVEGEEFTSTLIS